MAPDAQRAAVRRMALRGLDDIEIAQATGWPLQRIRDIVRPPEMIDSVPLALLRNRRSGSAGGSVAES
jgi:hypothetical protein